MDAEDKTLNLFTTRMRQMILLYKEKVQEVKVLTKMLEEQEKKTLQMQQSLAQAQRDYESLKMAKMLEVTDKDLETAKNKVAKIIRDINKCITLLNSK
jgi:phage terminase Nu1 subunit (DNA packaging protein)